MFPGNCGREATITGDMPDDCGRIATYNRCHVEPGVLNKFGDKRIALPGIHVLKR